METRIFVSNLIRKTYKNLPIQPMVETSEIETHLNSWNAHYMTFQRKRCWIVTHIISRYTVVIPDIKTRMIQNFRYMLIDCLANQLMRPDYSEHVPLETIEHVQEFIGNVSFFPTNNHKGVLATMNQRIYDLEYYKESGYTFDQIPFIRLAASGSSLATKKVGGKIQNIKPDMELSRIILVACV